MIKKDMNLNENNEEIWEGMKEEMEGKNIIKINN